MRYALGLPGKDLIECEKIEFEVGKYTRIPHWI